MPCYAIDGLVPVVDPTAYVHPTAVLIGDVIVGPSCYVGPCASMRGDFGRIVMERGANLQDTCVVHGFPGAVTLIEENGHVGHGAVLHGCVVRRDALVGMNAVIMDEAEVGAGAFVAASSFVPAGMRIDAAMLAAGVPAKVRRPLTDTELAWKAEGTRTYQALSERCLRSMVEVEPLTTAEPDRPALPTGGVRTLIATRRDAAAAETDDRPG